VSSEVLLIDLKCFVIMVVPRALGDPKGPSFLASILSCSSSSSFEKSGKTIFSHGAVTFGVLWVPLPSPSTSPHKVIAEGVDTGNGAEY
jgi:hypothetical protein